MKKLTVLFLTCLLILVTVFNVTAADEKFEMTIKTEGHVEAASVGSEVKVIVSCDSITDENGIMALEADLEYDVDVFQFIEGSEETADLGDDWEIKVIPTSNKLTLFATDDTDEATAPIMNSGKIYFSVSFKIKDSSKKSGSIEITNINAYNSNYDKISGKANSISIKVKQQLSAPTNLAFTADGLAKWDAVENADSYIIQLYKNNSEYGNYDTKNTEYDFSSILKDGGKYTFGVTAISTENNEFAPSEESTRSNSYTVIGKLITPSITIYSDLKEGGVRYYITDTNPNGTVDHYIIQVYKQGSETVVKEIQNENKSGYIRVDDKIAVGTQLTVTVTAITADETVNKTSDASDKSQPASVSPKVESISVKTAPKLVYTEGDRLALSGMVVTLNFDNDSNEDVSFGKFSDYDLKVNAENNSVLSMSDNGKVITVSFGDGISTALAPLTVNSSECPHDVTHTQTTAPTCGVDGSESEVCDSCKAVISETKLPATGEHQFGDWEIIVHPTSSLNGVQQRICSVCKEAETEAIPATGSGTTDSTSDSAESTTTTSETTDASDTTDAVGTGNETTGDGQPGGMNDLSKIFLIIVIVIFSLILIFIIGAVWIENRRSKSRRARAKRNSARRK